MFLCFHEYGDKCLQVAWRRTAGQAGISHWWLSDSHQQVQFSRGSAAMIILNIAAEGFHGRLYGTQLPAGVYCNAYRSGCEEIEILADGSSADSISVASDSVLALHTGLMKAQGWIAN